ncbi:MAG: twin-arginine translocase subunit TatC [Muribaculaceae bacterium]|nr:twin-arginine translocase subunit TatC [Muribaculaceae bacterium]
MASDSQMSFWDHLDALREVLIRIAIVVLVLAVSSFIVMPWVFDNVIMAPCSGSFPTYLFFDKVAKALGLGAELSTAPSFKIDIVSVELTSQLFVHMSASFWMAFMIGFPVIIYQLWGFVAPALYENERRNTVKAFIFGNVMFYLGVVVAYFIVFPLAVRFLAEYNLSSAIRPIVSLDSYMDNFFMLLIMMGAVFELPLLAWLLGRIGLLKRSFFKTYRRHAIVALLILAALITPTGDPFTLFLVFAPIYALWEMSARLVPVASDDDDDDL